MSLKIYKLTFNKAHFGDGELNDSQMTFDASRLFSALVLESMKMNYLKEFIQSAFEDEFVLSDAFPIIDNQLFIPKPIGYPILSNESSSNDAKENRQLAKKMKKLTYIPYNSLENYLINNSNIDQLTNYISDLAKTEPIMKKGEDPYEVGVTTFSSSLYIIANQSELFDSLMTSLQYSGIGGKRSSGYGQFVLDILDLPSDLENVIKFGKSEKVSLAISLSTSLPNEEEISEVMVDAKYILKKSSGFAYSTEAEELLRKQDFYKFKAGSTFTSTFKGYINDVRPEDFPHPVLNYAKGLFLVSNKSKVSE